METVIRNVGELDAPERSALERVIGHPLRESERIILSIQKLDLPLHSAAPPQDMPAGIPEHWKVFDGLSEAEVDDICSGIVRDGSSRDIDV